MSAGPFPPPTSPPRVKVCGLTRVEDARRAVELGASFLGFIFAGESPRCTTGDHVASILKELRSDAVDAESIRPVGVFVNEPAEDIAALAAALDLYAVQLHRDPTAEDEAVLSRLRLLRAISVRGAESTPAIHHALDRGSVLLDAFVPGMAGGTGKVFDHRLAEPFFGTGRVWIAGGLNPDNIGSIAATLAAGAHAPYAFDVSSGLESAPGVKSAAKLDAFFANLRAGWHESR